MKFVNQTSLKKTQITLLVVTGGLALTSGILSSTAHKFFGWQCPLFSNIHKIAYDDWQKTMKVEDALWGDQSDCYFTTFEAILVFMIQLITFSFLLQIDEMATADTLGGTDTKVAAFMLPIIIIDVLLLACTVTAASKLSDGFSVMCIRLESAENQLENPSQQYSIHSYTCKSLQDSKWTLNIPSAEEKKQFGYYNTLHGAEVTLWMTTVGLVCQILVACLEAYVYSGTYLSVAECQTGRRDTLGPAASLTMEEELGTKVDVDLAAAADMGGLPVSLAKKRWRMAFAATRIMAEQRSREQTLDALRSVSDYNERQRRLRAGSRPRGSSLRIPASKTAAR